MANAGRVALVHDWLVGWGGSESVLLSFSRLFPDAPIYTFVWDPDATVRERFGGRDIRPAIPNSVPGRGKTYRALLPFMPRAFARFDLDDFDLVVSSSHAFSKAVRRRKGAQHLCYCHTPPRYLWDLRDVYLPSWRGRLTRPLVRRLRRLDQEASRGVDTFVANSDTVAERIGRTYGRRARVVHPPVDVERFHGSHGRGDYFVAGGRLVGYKRVDLAVHVANRLGIPLKVFGRGSEERRLRRIAGATVEFLGWVTDDELPGLFGGARALLFPGEEDFGILPVEAQAAGTPVVALGTGGALETVIDGRTGVLYDDDSIEGLTHAMSRFQERDWDPEECRHNSMRFTREIFEEEVLRELSSLGPDSAAAADSEPTPIHRSRSVGRVGPLSLTASVPR